MIEVHRDEFARRGMLVVRGLMEPDVIRHACRETALLEQLDREIRIVRRPSGIYVSRIHLRPGYFGDLCHHRAFLPILQALIGNAELYVTFAQTIRKPPGALSLGWHQDAYYSAYQPDGTCGVESSQKDFLTGSINFWVALTQATRWNGGMLVAPHLHTFGLLNHTYDSSVQEWVMEKDPDDIVAIDLQPGDALVFTRLTPHRSLANDSARDRLGLIVNYSITPGAYGNVLYRANA
jgi:ectoine hydroxylase-related dioxygenase (phytanoyl-CoA dioxygenase family)